MKTTLYFKRAQRGDLEDFIRILTDNDYEVHLRRKGTVSMRVDISKNEPKDTEILLTVKVK